MGTVKFSAIIPTVDRPVLLRRAIESVQAQSYENIEIVVADNGNCEAGVATAAVCEELGVKRVVVPERGRPFACNGGIAATEGEYVSILDDDDLWTPEYAATLVPIIDNNPQMGALVCGKIARNRIGMERPLTHYDGGLYSVTANDFLMRRRQIGASVVMRRAEFEKVGGFHGQYGLFEDIDLYVRMMGAGCRFSMLERGLYIVTSDASTRMTGPSTLQVETIRQQLVNFMNNPDIAKLLSEDEWRRVKSEWEYCGVTNAGYVKTMGFGVSLREAREAALLRDGFQGRMLAAIAPLKIVWRMIDTYTRDTVTGSINTIVRRKV